MHVRRFWVSGIVLAAAIALLPFSFHAERHLETATRVEGSQAETVREELANRFRSPFVDRVVLVIQGAPPADSEEGGQALETIVAGLSEQPGVSGVVSYLELRDPIFLGRGGGTFVLVGLTSTDGPVESLVPELHQLASSLENQLRGRYPAVKLELTGEIPLNFDIRKASADDVQRGESPGDPRDPRTSAGGFWKPDRRPDSIGGWPACHRDHSGDYGIPGPALALVHSGSEFGHHAWPGPGNRLRAPHDQPLPGSDFRRARRTRGLGHRRHVRQVARS